jgi:hypothetical protein
MLFNLLEPSGFLNNTRFNVNPYPANVEKMVSSKQQMGFNSAFKGLKISTWCSVRVESFVRISEQTATFALYSIN